MKNIYIMLICIIITEFSIAQNWLWSHQAGGTSWDTETSTCMDGNGNTYLAGYYQSNPFYIGNESLSLKGFDDFFIAKYNSSGNMEWVKRFGGNNDSIYGRELIDFITYKSGFIYFTGSFADTCIFDRDTLVSSSQQDAFIAKMDTNGNVIWARKAGGDGLDYGGAMDVDPNGNVFVEFVMQGGGLIDTIQVGGGVYFTKWSPNGKCLLAKKIFAGNSIAELLQ